MASEAVELRAKPADPQTACQVPQGGAVASRALDSSEGVNKQDGWLPVRYQLCKGWIEASLLRCPRAGERSSWQYLSVPYHSQISETDSTRWDPDTTCGPTALTMLFDYYEWEKDVNVVTGWLDEIDPRDGGFDPTVTENPVGTSGGAMVQVAKKRCSSVVSGDHWTKQDLLAAITDHKPVVAGVSYRLIPGPYGHAITIIGFLENGERIIYHDPADDGANPSDKGNSLATWDALAASWVGPNDVGDPLQPAGHSFWALTCTK